MRFIIFLGLAANFFTKAPLMAEPQYFACDEAGTNCKLNVGKVPDSKAPYHAVFRVSTDFACQPGGYLSNLTVTAGEPASTYPLAYGARENFNLEGYGPVSLADAKVNGTSLDSFYPGCSLNISVTYEPSKGQRDLWKTKATNLRDLLTDSATLLGSQPSLMFWHKKYSEAPESYREFIKKQADRCKDTTCSRPQRSTAARYQSIIDGIPEQALTHGFQCLALSLSTSIQEAETLKNDLTSFGEAVPEDLPQAVARARQSLPAITVDASQCQGEVQP